MRKPLAWSATAGFGLVALGALLVLLPRPRSLHGDARFATLREIRRAGLFARSGLILGRAGQRFITLAGQQGVMLAAPPRSDKGVAQVIPNLLNWPGSVVCTDIKRENWTRTAGFRARHGQACYLFDPLAEDGRTARWNPFGYVCEDPHRRVNDVQRIADMLYPDPPNVDPFWTTSARSLFLGIALYLFETPGMPRTLGEVLRQGMASDDEGFGKHWKRVIEGRQPGRAAAVGGVCAGALRRDRSGAGHRFQHPQDLHQPPRPVVEPDPGCGHCGQRFRPAGAAQDAHLDLRGREPGRSAPDPPGAEPVLSAGDRPADARAAGTQSRARRTRC